ncbi:MAG TPA: hypothetical protein VGB82_22160 [Alphaproteobacteria bacterium]
MPLRRLVLAIMLSLFAAVASPSPGRAQDAQPAIRSFPVATLEKLGMSMAEQAQEASNADEILTAEGRNTETDGIVGWIFDPAADHNRVRFVRERGQKLEAAYDVIFTKSTQPKFVVPAKRDLTARETAQFRARQLAARGIEKPCSPVYNTLAVKDPGSDRWLVWVLATAADPGAVAVGGHTRFTISADGQTIVSRDALSLGCIVINPAPPAPGSQPLASFVTHLMSDTPVETHVFVSLLYNLPLLVGVPDQSVWRVERGKMQKLQAAASRATPRGMTSSP